MNKTEDSSCKPDKTFLLPVQSRFVKMGDVHSNCNGNGFEAAVKKLNKFIFKFTNNLFICKNISMHFLKLNEKSENLHKYFRVLGLPSFSTFFNPLKTKYNLI